MNSSQTQHVMEFAEKQPISLDDFLNIYLFEITEADKREPIFAETKERLNKNMRDFANEYLEPILDENGQAPSGMMQYYMQLWTDKDFYFWYAKDERTNEKELEEMRVKAEKSAEMFRMDMDELFKLDPKILNTKFQEDIMGYTRKRNTWEIYQRIFKVGNDIDEWYEILMNNVDLRKMYDMNYEWIEGAKEMNLKCQFAITMLIRPQQVMKNFAHHNTK